MKFKLSPNWLWYYAFSLRNFLSKHCVYRLVFVSQIARKNISSYYTNLPISPRPFYPQFTSVTQLTNHATHHFVCSQSSTKIAEKNRHRFSTRNYSITAVWKFKMESLMWMECSHCVRDMYLNDTIPLMEKSQMFYFIPSVHLTLCTVIRMIEKTGTVRTTPAYKRKTK